MGYSNLHPGRRVAPRLIRAAASCWAVVSLTVLAAFLPAESSAQVSRSVGVLTGVVLDSSGTRLVGAELTVLNSRAGTFSNDTGGFRVLGVPEGSGKLRVRRLGYAPRIVDIDVTAGASTHHEIVLARVPLNIEPVLVSAEAPPPARTGWAARFYQRMENGNGRFITREQIDRRNPVRVTDMLRSLPGVNIRPSRLASNTVYLRGQRCTPFIWIDNTPAMAGYVDLDNFEPSTLEGIEVYQSAANAPVELSVPNHVTACGMIVLWTRMPERPSRTKATRYTAGDLAAFVAALKVYTAEQVDVPAQLDAEAVFRPAYPAELRSEGVEGDVLAEFVVDTTGRVEMDTFGVVNPSRQEFINAVRSALPAARFTPAILEGRRVRQLVHLPVRFGE